ncbi:hypothetical protein X975_02714, partial [Stegodyphus mimosarum]
MINLENNVTMAQKKLVLLKTDHLLKCLLMYLRMTLLISSIKLCQCFLQLLQVSQMGNEISVNFCEQRSIFNCYQYNTKCIVIIQEFLQNIRWW